MHQVIYHTAEEALDKLRKGNEDYLNGKPAGDCSLTARLRTASEGQRPYAIVVCCSDSRVIPETMFCAGIGDLFVIRVAGNVIDDHQLGSIEYAAGHLGCQLVLVLGHDHCGAVDAAINHDPDGFIKYITDDIRLAIGEETDDYRACCLNVKHSIAVIESSLEIRRDEAEEGLRVLGALYRIESGRVEFFE